MDNDSQDQSEDRTAEKLARVYEKHAWMEPDALTDQAIGIMSEGASIRARRVRFFALADRYNAALKPVALCKAGCSHCCTMTTMLYRHEAVAIAKFSGRKMHELEMRPYDVAHLIGTRYFGTPCPFLKNNRCSVYDVRPLVCRLHHSLNDDIAACDSGVHPLLRSQIEQHDIDAVEMPYHLMVRSHAPEPWGAIQEFFP